MNIYDKIKNEAYKTIILILYEKCKTSIFRPKENFRKFYEVGKIIGKGEFHNIYEAKNIQNGKTRAIKIINLNTIINDFKLKYDREPSDKEMKIILIVFSVKLVK